MVVWAARSGSPDSADVSLPLSYSAHLGAGVHVVVDPMFPGRWRDMSAGAVTDLSRPLVETLIGTVSEQELRDGVDPLLVDAASATPWRRLAAVDVLDRWLYAPLNQALVDAERAVAGGRAARTLPEGPARDLILGDALRRARRSSRGVVLFLHEFADRPAPLSNALITAVQDLVEGFDELHGALSGPDHGLSVVAKTWRKLRRRADVLHPSAPYPSARPRHPGTTGSGLRSANMIDPRQIRARTVALAGDPAIPEVSLSASAAISPGTMHVRVPVFRGSADRELLARLAVRVVEHGSARSRAQVMLSAAGDGDGALEATVPLCGLDPAGVRVDVFDALSDLPPAAEDTDRALQEARRAVAFVSGWRRLASIAHLWAERHIIGRCLRDLADLVGPADGDDAPLYAGGPTPSRLRAMADQAGDELSDRLRGRYDSQPADMFPDVGGVAGPLVAELAAEHVRC